MHGRSVERIREKAELLTRWSWSDGFIDGSPETQKVLLDEMEGYLNHTQSEGFQNEYRGWSVILHMSRVGG